MHDTINHNDPLHRYTFRFKGEYTEWQKICGKLESRQIYHYETNLKEDNLCLDMFAYQGESFTGSTGYRLTEDRTLQAMELESYQKYKELLEEDE